MLTFSSWDKNAHWVRVYRARIRLGLETCRECGVFNVWGTERQLTLDHIHPRCKGGPSLMENATILCLRCNNEKGDGPARVRTSLKLEELRAPRKYRWSQQPVPVVPDGPWGLPQPPRSPKGRRRALEAALPVWARAFCVLDENGGVPVWVQRIIVEHYGGEDRVPQHVRHMFAEAG